MGLTSRHTSITNVPAINKRIKLFVRQINQLISKISCYFLTKTHVS